MATILIAEDHPFVREGIKSYLERTTPHEVVAECTTGLEALAEANAKKPDLLLVDLRLPELDGLEVIRRISQDQPLARIIVLSMHAGAAYVTRAVRYGAHGYLLKNSDVQILAQAIEKVLDGGTFFSPAVASFITEQGELTDRYDDLTTREREILQLVAEGKTAAEITNTLFISVRTVEKHRSNLMKKLGFHHQGEIIRYALQRGLIPLSDPAA